MQLRYRFKQLTRNGMWTSDSIFEGHYDAVVREVIARAAVEESTGRVIYAVDALGACTPASIALFESGLGVGVGLRDHAERSVESCERSRRRHDVAGHRRMGTDYH